MGSRFCLLSPSTCVTTARSDEKVLELKSLGLEAVEFDLSRENTWKNLPPQEAVSATIITFALSKSQLPELQKLFAKHIAVDKPILCLGTTSVFQVENHESVIDETTPLTGMSITGTSLKDRSEGENWTLSRGAAILHLSGIVGDKEEEKKNGKSRSVHSFFQKGYVLNGLKLVNFVHVKDICKIMSSLLKNAEKIKGQRIIVSCGAFRWRDLAKGLGIDSLPEFPPPDERMKGSKILSTAKLCSLLPSDYEWTLPVSGVEPVSRGLPSTGPHKYYPSGAFLDKQWDLMRRVFRGKWQATSLWYVKNNDDVDHGTFIEKMKAKELPPPSSVVPGTEYHIYFMDADTGIWHGKNLRFTSGEKILELGRKKFNQSGTSFVFGGAAGQCSIDFSSGTLSAECNFFYERSRSMIIVLYKSESMSGKFLLDSIAIAPFRCGHGHTFPLKPPQSENRRSVDTLLAGLNEKTCRMQWMSHMRGLDDVNGGEIQTMPTKSILLFSDLIRLVQSFDDDLVCSIPSEFEAGQHLELVFGCRHTDDFFQAVTLTFSDGKIEQYTYEKWD